MRIVAKIAGHESRSVIRQATWKMFAPAHHRGLLERRVHRTECGRHQQERHRRVVQAVDPDHPAHGVDVEERALDAEPRLHHQVDDADLGAGEQDPGDGEEGSPE